MILKEIVVESKTDVLDPMVTSGIGKLTNSIGEEGIEIEQLMDDEGAVFHQSFEESGDSLHTKQSSQMVCSGGSFKMEKGESN